MSKHFHFLVGAWGKAGFDSLIARIRFAALVFIFVISLIGMNQGVASAAGNTYYVDNTVACSNSGPGSLASPLCSIVEGALRANAGDTVHVLHGTYAETVTLGKSGTAGQPITFQADPGVTVTGNSAGFGSAFAMSARSYIVINGFNITQTKYMGIYVTGSHHITITNNEISYAGDPAITDSHRRGIYLSSTTDSTITGNTVHHNTCVGIMLVNGSDHNTISNNVSYANISRIVADAAGIALIGSSYNTLTNNITYGNEDSGISLYDYMELLSSSYNLIVGNLTYGNGDHGIDHNDAPYNTVVGNTIYGNGTVGINFEGSWVGSHHAVVSNNIIAGNGITPPSGAFGGNLRVDAMSLDGTTLDYDLFDRQGAWLQIHWNGTSYSSLAAFHVVAPGQEAHGLEGDPRFVTPIQPVLRNDDRPYFITARVGDFHLSAGSPAIDSANSDAPGQPATDLEGNPRTDDPDTTDSGNGTRSYDDRGVYEFQPSGATATTTTTTVVCGAGTPVVAYGSSLTCLATVARNSGSNTPGGKVHWATSDGGVFSPSLCTLAGSGGTASCSVSYVPHLVGSGSHLITANYAGNSNFLPGSGTQTVTVNTRALVPAITASSKTYDGTTAAAILTRSLTGVLGGDVVSLTGGTASFDTRQVGVVKTVTASGFSLTGLNAADYHLSPATATTTAAITARDLTVTAAGVSKVYDGTAAVSINLSTDALAGDAVTAAYTSASFADPNAGDGKAITVSGISISGADAGNYHLLNASAATAANITKATVTVTAADQSMDAGQPDPTFTLSYSGFVNGETVAVIDTPPTCGVPAAHTAVGTYTIVCSGGSDNNYSFSFVNGTLTVRRPFVQIFEDVPVDQWAAHFIHAIYEAGVTTGCSTSPLNYCPGNAVTRAQMAIFLLKAKHGSNYMPPAAVGVFGDVPVGFWAGTWIEQLAKEGITSGCGGGNYCPDAPVTRDQMAVFLLKAKYGITYVPPTPAGVFGDVSTTHWAGAWIEQLAREGITGGCGNGNYCPLVPVSRDQMAVFLTRTFGLPLP